MYGLIGSLLTLPENRPMLVEALLTASARLPGCISYVVSEDAEDASLVWVSEVWDSQQSHAAALELPAVKEAIAAARPLLLGFGARHTLVVRGGLGVP